MADQEKIYSTKECARRIRVQLKEEFPSCKFSVRTELYSGGSSIHMSLMSAPFKLVKAVEDIPEIARHKLTNQLWSHRSVEEQEASLREVQQRGYHQLNKYTLRDEYDENDHNNGVFLTRKGHELLKRAVEIADQYNWDNSDPMTDYFDVNYYLHVNIGTHEKDATQGDDELGDEPTPTKTAGQATATSPTFEDAENALNEVMVKLGDELGTITKELERLSKLHDQDPNNEDVLSSMEQYWGRGYEITQQMMPLVELCGRFGELKTAANEQSLDNQHNNLEE